MAKQTVDEFCIIITPHRSLGHIGFLISMTLIAVVSFIFGLLFMSIGAWPIAGFLGIDTVLIWGAFKLNYKAAEQYEVLERNGGDLILRRFIQSKEKQMIRFVKSFTRVEMFYDEEREISGPLYLATSDKRYEIANFLGTNEKLSLAAAIKSELKSVHD